MGGVTGVKALTLSMRRLMEGFEKARSMVSSPKST